MAIDLNSKDGRNKFINDKIPDLISAINDTYGPILLEELMRRIENTVAEFNNEINDAFEILKNKDKQRQNIYKSIDDDSIDLINENQVKTAWEKKIDEIES